MDKRDLENEALNEFDSEKFQSKGRAMHNATNSLQSAAQMALRKRFSPLRYLIVLIVGIFLAEVVAMVIVLSPESMPYQYLTLLDAAIMVVLIFPVAYFLSLRPLIAHIERRRDAEEALLHSMELQERFFDSIDIHIAYMDRNFNFIRVNEVYAKAAGHSPDFFIGKNHFDLYPLAENQAIFQQVVETGEGFSVYEKPFEYPDQPERGITYWNWSLQPVMEASGHVEGVVLSLVNVTERKRAEEKNGQLSRIVEQTTDTVVVTDCDGVIEYVNPAFEQATDYTEEEVLGNTPRVLKSGVHDNQFYKELWDTILNGGVFLGEIANRKKDGELFYEVKTISPLRDERGVITHFVATGKDITERKRAEEELQKANDELELRVQWRTEELRIANSELEAEIHIRMQAEEALRNARDQLELRVQERTKELEVANRKLLHEIHEREEVEQQLRIQTKAMEAAANGILITDPQGNIMWTNPALTHMSGYSKEELIGQHTRMFKSGQHDSNYYRNMWATILARQVWQGEMINRRKDGSTCIEEQTITPVLDEHDQIAFFIAIKQDVSEQKQVAAALEIERTRLRNILDTMPDGVYIINQNYDVEYVNPVIEREFGAVEGQKCYKYFHDLEEPCSWCKNEEVFTGIPFVGERTYTKNNKTYEIFDAPLDNSDGSISKLKLLHDITQRKKMEQELEQSNLNLQVASNAEHNQRQFAETLVAAALILNKSQKLDEVLTIILEQIKEVIPYQFSSIGLLDGESFYEASHHGDTDLPAAQVGIPDRYLLDDFPLLKTMCRSSQPILVVDTQQEADWIVIERFAWCHSFLSAPLIIEKKMIGFVNLFAGQAGFYTQEMSDRLVAFAAHAAVALQNAWLFEQVQASSERLQSLSRRLVEVQEAERLFISRELHDEAGQMLTSLMLDLRVLEKNSSQPEIILKKVAEMDSSLNKVSESLHNVAMTLRPASLDHLGLVPALRQHVELVEDKYGLKARFRTKGVLKRLPSNMETNLYRIVQETLTNVVRHAHATQVDVVLTVREGKLIVLIEDDGIGFNPEEVPTDSHLGLLGIRERVDMIDGNLMIESVPEEGTTIMVEVNYDNPIVDRG